MAKTKEAKRREALAKAKSVEAKLTQMTYTEIAAAYVKGKYSAEALEKAYAKLYRQVERQRAKIAKSNVPFIDQSDKEYFAKPDNITNIGQLVHEIADIARYKRSSWYSITSRRKIFERAAKTLAGKDGKDVVIPVNRIVEYLRFQRWLHVSGRLAAINYGSKEATVTELFNATAGLNSAQMAELFEIFESDADKSISHMRDLIAQAKEESEKRRMKS